MITEIEILHQVLDACEAHRKKFGVWPARVDVSPLWKAVISQAMADRNEIIPRMLPSHAIGSALNLDWYVDPSLADGSIRLHQPEDWPTKSGVDLQSPDRDGDNLTTR